ncbi:MAG: ester cyclase [Acidobacteriia bacterium]|nr:ester cyclase [Terriglobia bacterium]
MNPLEIAQQYFDAWNRRDAAAVLATFAADGTYCDPASGGRLGSEALAGYMRGLWAAFPDLSFEIASAGAAGPDLVAAQWIMRGTNTGSMMGLPPTGKSVTVSGADFIRVNGGKIQTVDGYFDSRAVPDQLGLQVLVQPKEIGPFSFGNAARCWGGKNVKPGAFSITVLEGRSPEETQAVERQSQGIVEEMLAMNGFLGFVGVTVGKRLMTISAWESAKDPRQLLTGGRHADAMKKFFGTELAAGGFTSVWVPDRVNTRWVRCAACHRMADHERSAGTCSCGRKLPEPLSYW